MFIIHYGGTVPVPTSTEVQYDSLLSYMTARHYCRARYPVQQSWSGVPLPGVPSTGPAWSLPGISTELQEALYATGKSPSSCHVAGVQNGRRRHSAGSGVAPNRSPVQSNSPPRPATLCMGTME
jgi:hypothetical protein